MKIDTRLGDLILELPDGVQVSSHIEDGETIRLFDAEGKQITPLYVAVGLCYENKNGNKLKVTSRVDANPRNISTNLQNLLSPFEKLYAIDTNQINIEGVEVCISCRVELKLENVSSQKWHLTRIRLKSFIFTDPVVHAELIGWQEFIENEISLSEEKNIGLIVDHDLGNIPLYNQRKKPYLGASYLPKNISLIYASAERDNNSPLNNAIKLCDSDANLLFSKIKNGSAALQRLSKANSELFEKSLYWSPSNA